jgi:hypothetical protein
MIKGISALAEPQMHYYSFAFAAKLCAFPTLAGLANLELESAAMANIALRKPPSSGWLLLSQVKAVASIRKAGLPK